MSGQVTTRPSALWLTALVCLLGAEAAKAAEGSPEPLRVLIERSGEDVRFVSNFDVEASPAACMMAALDFEAVNEESVVLTRVEPLTSLEPRPPEAFEVAYRMSFPGRTIDYVLAHTLSPELSTLSWSLAPEGSEKIEQLNGRLEVGGGPWGCAIAYEAQVRLGWKIPAFIEQRLSQVTLRKYLRGVRNRAKRIGQDFQFPEQIEPVTRTTGVSP